MNLAQAIARLDHNVEEHWTSDGLPRMDALVAMTGDAGLTRKRVTEAAPGLTRASARAQAESNAASSALDDELASGEEEVLGDAPEGLPENDDALGEDLDDDGDAGDEHVDSPSPAPPQVQPVHVLARPLHEVLASRELCELALEALGERNVELVRERDRLAEEIRQLSAKSGMLERAMVQHERRAPNTEHRRTVGDYLERQKEIRAARAARVARFAAAGVTPEDLREHLSGASKLDRAMAARKPPLGSRRPDPRPVL